MKGGRVLGCNDMTFSKPPNLIMPGRGVNMGDGWETRRRRGAGHDWCVLRLGHRGNIGRVVVDTCHFKGNYPASFSLDVVDCDPAENLDDIDDGAWRALIEQTELGPDAEHEILIEGGSGPCTVARLNIFPDGGMSRLRLFGEPVLAPVPGG